MKINGKRFADSWIDYGHPANFAILFYRTSFTALLMPAGLSQGVERYDVEVSLRVGLVAYVSTQN